MMVMMGGTISPAAWTKRCSTKVLVPSAQRQQPTATNGNGNGTTVKPKKILKVQPL